MSQYITNENGEQVEVFTPEEVQEQKETALEALKVEKDAELEAAQAELRKTNDELGKFKDKDFNFAKVRQQKEEAEEKVDKIKQEMEESLGNFKKEIFQGVLKKEYDDLLESLAGDDADLKKKIEFEYNRLNDPAGNAEEIAKKIRDAHILATRTDGGNAVGSFAVSSGGAGKPQFKQSTKFTAEEKDFGKKLAQSAGIKLKEEDFN